MSVPPHPNGLFLITTKYLISVLITDPELCNVIDKLAMFVARNGSQFEAMTKAKQKDNPKFSFLYSGAPFHEYYSYRIGIEAGCRVL
jgi:hypothetical protein